MLECVGIDDANSDCSFRDVFGGGVVNGQFVLNLSEEGIAL